VWWVAARALAWCIALPLLMLAGVWLAAVSSAGPSILILALLATFGAVAAFVGLIEGVVLERLLHKLPVVMRSAIDASSP
jgi:predicted anti-sigma-YlaC factor YlaD